MDCRTTRDLLPLLAGGDLPSGEAHEAWAHVGVCVTCRGELAAWTSARASLALLQQETADMRPLAGLEQQILARIAAEPVQAARSGWRWLAGMTAAAALLVGFALGLRDADVAMPEPMPTFDPTGLGLEVAELGGEFLPAFPATRPAGFAEVERHVLSRPLHRTSLAAPWLTPTIRTTLPAPALQGRGELQGLMAQQAALRGFGEQEQRLLADVLGADPTRDGR